MKKLTLLFSALVSATLLSSYSAVIAADIRPEVAEPLDQARVLAKNWRDHRAAIMANLNQAASVPNLNEDEVRRIRATGDYVFARAGVAKSADPYVAIAPPLFGESSPPSTSTGVGYTGLH